MNSKRLFNLTLLILVFLISTIFLKISTETPSPKDTAYTAPLPLILMYHDILNAPADQLTDYDVSTSNFRNQMQFLKRQGYTFISAEELYTALKSGNPLPTKSALITFDDGYIGVAKYAYPYLTQQHIKASFFVHTRYIGKKTFRNHMSWTDLKKINSNPLFKVYPHTVSHPHLSKISESAVQFELKESQRIIQTHLASPAEFTAYPYGEYDDFVINITKKFYKMAFSTHEFNWQSKNIYAIPRLSMKKHTDTDEKFSKKIKNFINDNK